MRVCVQSESVYNGSLGTMAVCVQWESVYNGSLCTMGVCVHLSFANLSWLLSVHLTVWCRSA